jgi:hypothetical protein
MISGLVVALILFSLALGLIGLGLISQIGRGDG